MKTLGVPLSEYSNSSLKTITRLQQMDKAAKKEQKLKLKRIQNKRHKKERNSEKPESEDHFYKKDETEGKAKGCGCKTAKEGKFCNNNCSCKAKNVSCSQNCKGCRNTNCGNPHSVNTVITTDKQQTIEMEDPEIDINVRIKCGCKAGNCLNGRCSCKTANRCSIWCSCGCSYDSKLLVPAEIEQKFTVCIVDTETTGLSNDDQVLEFCVYVPSSQKSYSVFIMPTIPIPKAATNVHGITLEKLTAKKAKTFAEVGQNIIDAVAAMCELPPLLIAHNAGFDKRMIETNFKNNNIKLPKWQWCNSVPLLRRLMPDRKAKKWNLETLSKELKLKAVDHSATGDVQNLWSILSYAVSKICRIDSKNLVLIIKQLEYYFSGGITWKQ
jgi:DNA polymerase III epsilon subunit-like protein